MRFLLAALAVLLPSAAIAQIPTSTRDPMTTPGAPSRSEIARTDSVLRDVAACVTRRQPSRTLNLLRTIPGTDAEVRVLSSFQSVMNSCYNSHLNQGRSMSLSLPLLRGIFAETWLRGDFPDGLAAAAGQAPPPDEWIAARLVDGVAPTAEKLHSMTRCVTTRRPAGINGLLAAAPLGPEESAAFSALQPDLVACLDAGIELTASRQALRALLAEAAYHYARGRRDGFTWASRADD
jgi:hypothetical protein